MTSSALILGPMLRYVDETSASIWCETAEATQVDVAIGERVWSARTFGVHGHHFALVEVNDLAPGTLNVYEVRVAGETVWPLSLPRSVIATLDPDRPLHLSFGSCRTSVPHDRVGNRTHGVDALRATALQLMREDEGTGTLPSQISTRPDLLLFLGDQVYADSASAQMRQFIERRRDITQPPGDELADFEEYAHLYRLAWSDEANRWLLSTVPTAMIFDDHDIRDDWNASLSWKQQMEQTSWWHGRIVAGLAAYWVYQHLGNLSPAERATDEIWQRVARHTLPTRSNGNATPGRGSAEGEFDLSAVLDDFATRCDREPTTYRWSFTRDISGSRLIVLDSRASRALDPQHRAVLNRAEVAWLDEQMRGGFRHLIIGTSLPFLLPEGLHHLESWNEAVSEGAWGARSAAIGEKLRQGLDLEHWAAFQRSFHDLAHLATEVADGKRGPAPDTVTFLSGDVHYSYLSEVHRSHGSRIIQAVCSPIRNPLPIFLRSFSAVLSYGISGKLTRWFARAAGVPAPPLRWHGLKGPWFDNCLGSLAVTPHGLRLWWVSGAVRGGDYVHPRLTTRASLRVARRRALPRRAKP